MKSLHAIKEALELNIAIQQDFTKKHTSSTLSREEYEILLIGYCAMKEALSKINKLIELMESEKLINKIAKIMCGWRYGWAYKQVALNSAEIKAEEIINVILE